MQEGTSAVHEDAWGAGYSDGGDGRPQSWPDADTLPDYEAGHAAGKEDGTKAAEERLAEAIANRAMFVTEATRDWTPDDWRDANYPAKRRAHPRREEWDRHDDGVAAANRDTGRPFVRLQPETVGSRTGPRTRFRVIVAGENVGQVEAETSDAVRGVMLRGESFGRYGSRIRDHSIEALLVKRSERRRLGETIRRIMGLAKDVEGL